MKGLRAVSFLLLFLAAIASNKAADPILLAEWMDVPMGSIQDVAPVGKMAWIGIGAGGIVLADFSDPSQPTRLAYLDTVGFAYAVAPIFTNRVAVADGPGGLQILALNAAGVITNVGRFATTGDARSVQISGTNAFVLDNAYGLRIIDISDPVNPALLGGYQVANASLVRVEGPRAYLMTDGIVTLDISNPTSPAFLGKYSVSSQSPNYFAISGNTLFATYGSAGMRIVDLTNPANGSLLGSFNLAESYFSGVAVAGNRAFLATSSAGLIILDISDPLAPTELAREASNGDTYVNPPAPSGNLVYVPVGNALKIIDVTNPSLPNPLGYFDTAAINYATALRGNYAYAVGDGFRVFDITDPTHPNLVSFQRGFRNGALAITFKDNLALISVVEGGLAIYDISDPAHPALITTITSALVDGRTRKVVAVEAAVHNNIVYLAEDSAHGSWIFDITNPSAPVVQSAFLPPADALAVQGNYLYILGPLYDQYIGENLVSTPEGLHIFDITDPIHPVKKSDLVINDVKKGITVSGNVAYVANYSTGFRTIDISNPSNPRLLDLYDTPGAAMKVTVANPRAYVADQDGGLLIFDVSNPTNIVRTGRFNTYPDAENVSVLGNLALLANGAGPLQFLNVGDPIQPTLAISIADSLPQLSTAGEKGRRYTIFSAATVDATTWTSSAPITLTNNIQTVPPFGTAAPQQFYRAVVAP